MSITPKERGMVVIKGAGLASLARRIVSIYPDQDSEERKLLEDLLIQKEVNPSIFEG